MFESYTTPLCIVVQVDEAVVPRQSRKNSRVVSRHSEHMTYHTSPTKYPSQADSQEVRSRKASEVSGKSQSLIIK